MSLLNHFYFESFLSHVIQVYIFAYISKKLVVSIFLLLLLSSTVMFFLHCMLNNLRYEKIFCETDKWTAPQHDSSIDVIFLGYHGESILPFMEFFFFSRKLRFLRSPCLLLITELISLDTSGRPMVEFFLKITSPS